MVEAKAVLGKWWPATISRVHADGHVDVTVDDGRESNFVKSEKAAEEASA